MLAFTIVPAASKPERARDSGGTDPSGNSVNSKIVHDPSLVNASGNNTRGLMFNMRQQRQWRWQHQRQHMLGIISLKLLTVFGGAPLAAYIAYQIMKLEG